MVDCDLFETCLRPACWNRSIPISRRFYAHAPRRLQKILIVQSFRVIFSVVSRRFYPSEMYIMSQSLLGYERIDTISPSAFNTAWTGCWLVHISGFVHSFFWPGYERFLFDWTVCDSNFWLRRLYTSDCPTASTANFLRALSTWFQVNSGSCARIWGFHYCPPFFFLGLNFAYNPPWQITWTVFSSN